MACGGVLDEQRDLDPVSGAEFGQQPGYVCLDGGQAHVQLGGDVGVGMPLGDGGGDFVLAGGESGELAPRSLLPGGGIGISGNEADEAAGDRGR